MTECRELDVETEAMLDRRASVLRLKAFDWRAMAFFDDFLAGVAVDAELDSGRATVDVCLRFCALLPVAGILVLDCFVTWPTTKINRVVGFTNALDSVSSIVDLLARVSYLGRRCSDG